MNASIWSGTPLADFACDIERSLPHGLAFAMGVAETTARGIFDIIPETNTFPDEARRAMLVMVNVQVYRADEAEAEREIARLLQSYRERRRIN